MSKNKSDLEQSFDVAVEAIRESNPYGSKRSSDSPTDEEKLQFYGLYKQATCGDCDTSQPWTVQFVERAKWDSWNANKGMKRNDAMLKYCDLYLKASKKYGI